MFVKSSLKQKQKTFAAKPISGTAKTDSNLSSSVSSSSSSSQAFDLIRTEIGSSLRKTETQTGNGKKVSLKQKKLARMFFEKINSESSKSD